jgi:hypothetical protein
MASLAKDENVTVAGVHPQKGWGGKQIGKREIVCKYEVLGF